MYFSVAHMMALTQGGEGWQGLGKEAGGEAGEEAGEEAGKELKALGEQAIPGTSIKIHIPKTTVMGVLYRSYGNQSLARIG